jgi:hypothetical protein
MPQLTLPCPHCGAEKVGFTPRGAVPVRPGVPLSLLFLQCEGCGQGVIGLIQGAPSAVQHWITGSASSPGALIKTYPISEASKSPADVPPKVEAAFYLVSIICAVRAVQMLPEQCFGGLLNSPPERLIPMPLRGSI